MKGVPSHEIKCKKKHTDNKSGLIAHISYIRVAQNQLTEFARFTKSNAT